MLLRRQVQCLLFAAALVGLAAVSWPAGAQTGTPARPEGSAASFEALQKSFEAGMARIQESIKTWESRASASAGRLAQTRERLGHAQVKIASLKATMVLEKLPLLKVHELAVEFANREKDIKASLQELGEEIKNYEKVRQTHVEEQNSLRTQFGIIAAKAPTPLPAELQQSFLTYLDLAGRRDDLAAQVLDQLEQRRRLLEQEQGLVAGLTARLQEMESAWQAQLLKRPAQAVPLGEQVIQAWKNLAAIPLRVWNWSRGLLASGSLGDFLWKHLAPILGLVCFLFLLGWSHRRLTFSVAQWFQVRQDRNGDPHLAPLYVLAQTLAANLFGMGLILWLGLFFWSFSLINLEPAWFALLALTAYWVLRLGLQLVQKFFAGQAAGGVLALEPDVARFYRRSLKIFLIYLFLEFITLKTAVLFKLPGATRFLLAHVFQVGTLVWGWWLLRRRYLNRLLPQFSDSSWLHQPVAVLTLRKLLVVLVVVIILADLLGFQNLSMYLADASAWTLMAALFLWLLWLIGKTILRHQLHPQAGRATRLLPAKADLAQRVYTLSHWVLALVLVAAAAPVILESWGISTQQVAGAFRWLTWGPALGPVKLNTLSIIAVVLALYLGLVLSRLARGLMMTSIFPRTAFDTGAQYTITTTVHYVILTLAALIALNILGFPLTNLLLVFGALGVGIGFGLQNIVNNFLSGLILLFERPIKVGDMLVIDGQWGLVKEIRVRSTIFQTFDRYVLIIPNSELVSNKVLNWTHYGAGINRLTLKVGVSYGSDVRRVTQLITEVCSANQRVVQEPPPQIFFAAYGDSSLDFTIWVHLWTPADRIPATHELNTAIFDAFREHGIEVPFPQRDLHVKEWPGPAEKEGESPLALPPHPRVSGSFKEDRQ